MRLNISAWSIRRPVPAIVLFAVLTLLGVISFMTLPVTRFPNIDVPLVSITVVQSGAAPAELESQVTKEVEDAVANITGVKHIMSTVTDGYSTTVIEFRLEIKPDRALNDVKDAIAKIRLDLPRDIDEPIVQRIDVEGQSILTYAASSPGMTLEQLSWHVDDVIKRQLQGLKGVGRIERYGGVDREIRILLDPDRLLALGITAAEVNNQVRATNVDLGGGRGEVGGQEQAIRTLAGARTVEELAETKIMLAGGREVRLSDLGQVIDDASEPRSFARLNGEPVVTFAVFRSKGSSELSVADVVNAKLAELGKQYPDIRLTKIDDAVAYTRGNYNAAMETLIEGAALGRARRVHLPAQLARDADRRHRPAAVGHPDVLGDGADGLLAQPRQPARHHAGHRHPRRRRHRRDREHRPPHAHGQIALSRRDGGGRRDRPRRHRDHADHRRDLRARVVHGRHRRAVFPPVRPDRRRRRAVLAARRAPDNADDGGLPAAARFPRSTRGAGFVMRGLRRLSLRATLKVRYLTLVVGLGLFAGSIYATTLLPTGFMPDEDTSRVVVSVELPPGATLEDTRVTTDKMVEILQDHPRGEERLRPGRQHPDGRLEVRKASLFVQLVPKTERAAAAERPQGHRSPTSSPRCPTRAPGTSTSAASASCRSRCCRTTARS